MRGINKVFILGNLGHDPELKKTANGVSFTDLSIATNRPIRRQDEWEECVEWHHIRTWDSTAEMCIRILEKGCTVAVEGQLRTDVWLDPEGSKRSKTYIHAHKLHFLSQLRGKKMTVTK